MSNNKQSSVEWFAKESWKLRFRVENKEITIGEYAGAYFDLIEQAKAMHKEESISYAEDFGKQMLENKRFVNAEIIYNETYGGNK